MKNFVYLLGAPHGDEAVVVDPAWDVPAIFEALASANRQLVGVFLTHHHHDHINGVPEVLARRDVPVFVQSAEAEFGADPLKPFADALRVVSPSERVKIAGAEISCLHTPGHTPGSQCLSCGGAVFTGDTLFVNACGRCDFQGGDPRQMHDSLFNVLGALDGSTTVYAGHDYGDVKVSSLERERSQNPYFQLRDVNDFVRFRMRPRT